MRNLTWLSLLGVALAAGCSDKKTTQPTPQPSPYEKANSPEAVLRNLEVAFEAKDVAGYDSLFYVCGGDTANAFRFWFAQEDVASGLPASWGREAEACAAAKFFETPTCGPVTFRLTFGPSYADPAPGREGQKIINVTDVYMTVVDSVAWVTYLIQGQRSDFRFKAQWVDAKGDSLWRIVYWKDWASGAGKSGSVREMTWGRVKSLFDDGCLP